MSFSERMGYKKVRDVIQIDKIDSEFLTDLYNTTYKTLLFKSSTYERFKSYTYIFTHVWLDFFKKPIDEIPYWTDWIGKIKQFFFSSKWYEVYDFIEFIITPYNDWALTPELANIYNECFIRNKSGYRIIDHKVMKITSESEIDAIENAIDDTDTEKFANVNVHLKQSLNLLSNKENPDCRNSIKESISAVEALCRQLTGESTLDKALNKINKIMPINSQLKDAFGKLYHYTNGEDGIRHALMDENGNATFDEAKFMLVACTAFISYIISKQTQK